MHELELLSSMRSDLVARVVRSMHAPSAEKGDARRRGAARRATLRRWLGRGLFMLWRERRSSSGHTRAEPRARNRDRTSSHTLATPRLRLAYASPGTARRAHARACDSDEQIDRIGMKRLEKRKFKFAIENLDKITM